MQHQDGFCDRCGCHVGWPGPQLTITGEELCAVCALGGTSPATTAKRPEARDDGR